MFAGAADIFRLEQLLAAERWRRNENIEMALNEAVGKECVESAHEESTTVGPATAWACGWNGVDCEPEWKFYDCSKRHEDETKELKCSTHVVVVVGSGRSRETGNLRGLASSRL